MPTSTPTVPARDLASLCDLARLVCCRHCLARPHQPCDCVGGVHLVRFAYAAHCGLIRGPEISLVLGLAGNVFTSGTVIGGGKPLVAPHVGEPVKSPVRHQVHADPEEAAL
jgi:hypothetical protein